MPYLLYSIPRVGSQKVGFASASRVPPRNAVVPTTPRDSVAHGASHSSSPIDPHLPEDGHAIASTTPTDLRQLTAVLLPLVRLLARRTAADIIAGQGRVGS
jgi:hypothetical protein